jgi:hypothetical protein
MIFDKYNILGDTHGRPAWKNLVIEDGKNIFTGDYFSPYNKEYTYEECKDNFLQIIDYKIKHPETELLIGNHDEDHWNLLGKTHVSRHDYTNANEIRQIFEEYRELFKMAVSIENKYLVTHAGVSMPWYYNAINKSNAQFILLPNGNNEKNYNNIEEAITAYSKANSLIISVENRLKFDSILFFKNEWYECKDGNVLKINKLTPDEVAQNVNKLWKDNPFEFSFERCAAFYDTYGNSVTQSPVWIRPDELNMANIFKATEYHQIVGHTMFEDVKCFSGKVWDDNLSQYVNAKNKSEIIFVDCLASKENSYIISKNNLVSD